MLIDNCAIQELNIYNKYIGPPYCWLKGTLAALRGAPW